MGLKLDRLTTDEASKKAEITRDEKKYKDLAKNAELNTKANETKQKRTQELAKAEKDSKYAKRKAALTKQVLAENEADTKVKVKSSEQEAEEAKKKANSDERKEKDAAVALKKATTEKDTKKLMRTELNWKSVFSKSNELVTKADQQKMLSIEDNTQAQAKMQANKCVELCREGLKMKQKEFLSKEAVPAALKKEGVKPEEVKKEGVKPEEAATPVTGELLEIGETNRKGESAAVQAAKLEEVKMMPAI